MIFVPSFDTGTNGGFGLPPSWFRKVRAVRSGACAYVDQRLDLRDFGMEDDEVTAQVRNRAEIEAVQKAVAGRFKRSGSER